MPAEGRLKLTLRWDGSAVTAAHVHSERAIRTCRLLRGRSPEEAIDAVGLLFSVCRRSQQAAARIACEAAREGGVEPASLATAQLAALSEFAIESLWRLLLDAPALVGETPRQREFVAARTRLASLASSAAWPEFADALDDALGILDRGWFDLTLLRLLTRPAHAMPCTPLPWIDARALVDEIAPRLSGDGAYADAPSWHGMPAETGSIARMGAHPRVRAIAHHPIAARVVARWQELQEVPSRIRDAAADGRACWVRAARGTDGTGLAALETARGTLIHDVAVDGDRVARWNILAPTEWNFHPQGAFVQGVVGMRADDANAARAAGEGMAFALDPCVAVDVEVAHA
jgi:coenzyme F420-reducing hydrogenase alpha subunit